MSLCSQSAKQDNPKGLTELLGTDAAQKIFDQLPPGVVVAAEAWLLRYRPDISIFDEKPVVVAAN